MKTLIIDNYDSFTYNLVHLVNKITGTRPTVVRNDKFYSLNNINEYHKIILSPGPGIPNEAGELKRFIEEFAPTKSILGVCLGMQAIAEVFGSELINMTEVVHGMATDIFIIDENEMLFNNVPHKTSVGRYHSWVVNKLSNDLTVTAKDIKGHIMAIRHNKFDVRGVQFHPESILTKEGETMMFNFINNRNNNFTLPDANYCLDTAKVFTGLLTI